MNSSRAVTHSVSSLYPCNDTKVWHKSVKQLFVELLNSEASTVPIFSRWRLPQSPAGVRTYLCSFWPPRFLSELWLVVGGKTTDESLEVCGLWNSSRPQSVRPLNRKQYNLGCIKLLIIFFQIPWSMFPKCWILINSDKLQMWISQ